MRLSYSLLFCFVLGHAWGQEEEGVDTVRVSVKKPDSLREKIYPRAFRVGTDVLALILSGSNKFSGWEVNGDLDLVRYYLAAEYGAASRNEVLATGGSYQNEGTYWRIGVDINLLKKDPDRNMFFLGFRYGHASYSESLDFVSSDPYFSSFSSTLKNPAVTAAWGELTTGLRVKVWKEFWMGYTARMKFAGSAKGDDAVGAYNVPGFGVIGQGITWGFNYQLFWRFPFPTKKKPVRS